MTTLYKDKYNHQRETIGHVLTRNPNISISDVAGIASLATGVHILIVCHFLSDLVGWTPELITTLNINKLFYKIDAIV